MDKQHITDNKFYIILAVAILALVVGTTGLVVSLQRPSAQSSLPKGGTNSAERTPVDGDIQTVEIDPSAGHGVAESPKKN